MNATTFRVPEEAVGCARGKEPACVTRNAPVMLDILAMIAVVKRKETVALTVHF